jgi:hypothetical protein
MQRTLAHAGLLVGWVLVVLGAIAVGANVPVLYMLASGLVEPGEPYWIDDLAPTMTQALVSTAIACAGLAIGLLVKRVAKRYASNPASGA